MKTSTPQPQDDSVQGKNDQNDAITNDVLDDLKSKYELEISELKNKYLRALADYQNLERRVRDDRTSDKQYASEAVLVKLIPIIDSLVLAQAHIRDAGLELVIKDILSLLTGFGATKLEVIGKTFDPGTMECIEVVEGKNGIVVSEVASGYMLGKTLIRAAKVNVGQEKNHH